jgi:16S rRNA (cytosine1402-N4)-methyltransferase
MNPLMQMPASHQAVLEEEAMDALNLQPHGVYVDCTFGRGGHSRLILDRLGDRGRLIALDRDPDAVAAAREIRDPRFTIAQSRFSRLRDVLRGLQIERVDGVLLDLGVSSPQLNDAARGFSFSHEGPLDMRMDPTSGITAAEWLATAQEVEIARVIKTYGEERFAKRIARAIGIERTKREITTTRELADVVSRAVPTREPGQHPATRTFQALRVYLNRELDELEQVLPQCLDLLVAGGRLVTISFHSLEDRIVKSFFALASRPEALPEKLPVKAANLRPAKLKLLGKLRPQAAEVQCNPRARSALMRIAQRLAEP